MKLLIAVPRRLGRDCRASGERQRSVPARGPQIPQLGPSPDAPRHYLIARIPPCDSQITTAPMPGLAKQRKRNLKLTKSYPFLSTSRVPRPSSNTWTRKNKRPHPWHVCKCCGIISPSRCHPRARFSAVTFKSNYPVHPRARQDTINIPSLIFQIRTILRERLSHGSRCR